MTDWHRADPTVIVGCRKTNTASRQKKKKKGGGTMKTFWLENNDSELCKHKILILT